MKYDVLRECLATTELGPLFEYYEADIRPVAEGLGDSPDDFRSLHKAFRLGVVNDGVDGSIWLVMRRIDVHSIYHMHQGIAFGWFTGCMVKLGDVVSAQVKVMGDVQVYTSLFDRGQVVDLSAVQIRWSDDGCQVISWEKDGRYTEVNVWKI